MFHPHPPWFRLGILFIRNFSPFSHPPRETHRSFPCSGAIAREAAVVASRHGERPPLVRYIQKWPPMWPVRLLSASHALTSAVWWTVEQKGWGGSQNLKSLTGSPFLTWPLIHYSFHRFHSSLRHVFALAGVLPLAWNKREPPPQCADGVRKTASCGNKNKNYRKIYQKYVSESVLTCLAQPPYFFYSITPLFFSKQYETIILCETSPVAVKVRILKTLNLVATLSSGQQWIPWKLESTGQILCIFRHQFLQHQAACCDRIVGSWRGRLLGHSSANVFFAVLENPID